MPNEQGPCGPGAVLRVVTLLTDAGLECIIDGGWAVDALLGEQTRVHADLDLALPQPDYGRALDVLRDAGFVRARFDGPHNEVVADSAGVSVDLHAFDRAVVEIGADGIARHGGDGLAYEVEGFGGVGSIDGTRVACIAPATLVRYHTGYAVDPDDWHDVSRLCARFGLPIPPDYDRFRS